MSSNRSTPHENTSVFSSMIPCMKYSGAIFPLITQTVLFDCNEASTWKNSFKHLPIPTLPHNVLCQTVANSLACQHEGGNRQWTQHGLLPTFWLQQKLTRQIGEAWWKFTEKMLSVEQTWIEVIGCKGNFLIRKCLPRSLSICGCSQQGTCSIFFLMNFRCFTIVRCYYYRFRDDHDLWSYSYKHGLSRSYCLGRHAIEHETGYDDSDCIVRIQNYQRYEWN